MIRAGSYTHPFMDEKSYLLFGRSIIPHIVVLVALVSFTPLLLVSGLVLDQFSISHNAKLYAHLREVVHKHSRDIDSFLNERLHNIQFLSTSCGLERFLNDSFLRENLFALKQVYGNIFEDLGIVNQEGIQEFYAGRLNLEKARYGKAKWFSEAFQQQDYISDVFLGLRSSPHFIISSKIPYKGNSYLLKATINFDSFNSLAENLRIGKTGFAYILNKKGEFQTKPHYEMLSSKMSYQDFIKFGKEEKRGTYIGTFNDVDSGKEIIYVANTLKGQDWILVFQQEKSEAYSDLFKAQYTAGFVIFVGALLIVVMNVILFHKVIKRIAEADQQKEMMNRQVIETGKLASIGELAAGIAHEINNPVAIMVQEAGWIEDLLAEEDLKNFKNVTEFKKSLNEVNIQGQRCKEITKKLLSFARKTSAKIEEVQVNDLIREIVAITNMEAYNKISMTTRLDGGVPTIYGNQTEIQQVLLNLINNALYFLEKDGGEISIISKLEAQHVLIVVEDDGPGIPESNIKRVFDPFFTTKPVGDGSGLGLSIIFGIIHKMGGEIDVHSVVNKGTRFEIRLPLESPMKDKTKSLIEKASTAAQKVTDDKSESLIRQINLLLVDDEKSFANVLARRLEKRNMEVTTVYNGTDAIQALRKIDFDVAVLDVKLPDIDGLEVLKIFKKMYSKMQVVMLSGHGSEKTAMEGLKHGAFEYLVKPCEMETLVQAIRKSISA